jgi:hypothetical protein
MLLLDPVIASPFSASVYPFRAFTDLLAKQEAATGPAYSVQLLDAPLDVEPALSPPASP